MATLMLDAFRDANPCARVRRFSFRALAPSFCGEALHAGGRPDAKGRAALWIRGADGGPRLTGDVVFD
jgi:hydroxyacyl-ACP dehydratase HTD2-like protein with hotdog domain